MYNKEYPHEKFISHKKAILHQLSIGIQVRVGAYAANVHTYQAVIRTTVNVRLEHHYS